jgi:ABC-type transport system involved in multi-copper enzyme maturation permease subunit
MNTIASNNLNPSQSNLGLSPSMENHAFRNLCVKEIRQCLPLVIAIVVVSVFLHVLLFLMSFRDPNQVAGAHHLIFMLTPCLFAIGAGAMLVSQEKELRSIGWLCTLPISHRNILISKLIAAFAGLTFIWLVNLGYLAFFRIEHTFNLSTEPVSFLPLFSVLNSIFLTLLSILTAWRFQSTLVALVMIVPLGILQTSMVMGLQVLREENRVPDLFVASNYLLFSVLALWYGWRSGLGYLSSRPSTIPWQAWLAKRPASTTYTNYLYARTLGPVSSLVWQFATQNRMLVAAGVIMVASPAFSYLLLSRRDQVNFPLPLLIYWLVASWLGATVFQSDATQQRIRFLAERGVKPSTVWWTRQFIPLSLAIVSAVILLFYSRDVIRTHANSGPYGSQPFPLLVLGAPIILLIHAAAQWQGQLIRSPIVSLLAAPATVLGAVGYAAFAVTTLGSPFWLIFVSIAIAIAATRLMMPAWMDGRTGLRYWAVHGTMLALAFLIPAIPFFYTCFTYPSMPASELRAFKAELATAGGRTLPLYELVLRIRKPTETDNLIDQDAHAETGGAGGIASSEGSDPVPTFTDTANPQPAADVEKTLETSAEVNGGEAAYGLGGEMGSVKQPWELVDTSKLSFAERIVANVKDLETQLAENPGPIRYSPACQFLLSEATLMRLNLNQSPTDEANLDRYRRVMRLLNDVVGRLRSSWRLIDQSAADQLERAMLADMKRQDAREVLGATVYNSIAKTLANKQYRKQARRRAIVLSWAASDPWRYDTPYAGRSVSFDFGGYGPLTQITNDLNSHIIARRRLSRVAWLLSQYLESKDQAEADQRFAEVAKEWGIAINRSRNSNFTMFRYGGIAGADWLGEWENEAEKLK